MKAKAYSYVRFSSLKQRKGETVRRQEEARDHWLKETGIPLDTSLNLRDLGVSSFHGQNVDIGALGVFLKKVEDGTIKPGSFLLVENLDRLSRDKCQNALRLFLNILHSGIKIVQLIPRIVYDENSQDMDIMMAISEFRRGHSESQMKSERVNFTLTQKKKAAREGTGIVTTSAPAWMKWDKKEKKFILDPQATKSIQTIFKWATTGMRGMGISRIVKKLNSDNVQPITGKNWTRSYVAKILSNRATFGEYQPHATVKGKRKPDGDPIPNYYPPVISETLFYAARSHATANRGKGGRGQGGTDVNLWLGLLKDARTGSSVIARNPVTQPKHYLPMSAVNGMGSRISFPQKAFDGAVTVRLEEIDPADILPKKERAGIDLAALSGRLTETDGAIAKTTETLLAEPTNHTLINVLTALNRQRNEVLDALAEAREQVASPMAEAWGDAHALMLRGLDEPDTRLRLRSALRQIIESVWVLFMGESRYTRLAWVQIHFNGGEARNIIIRHDNPIHSPLTKTFTDGQTVSMTYKKKVSPEYDLRHPDNVKNLENILRGLAEQFNIPDA